MKTATKSTRRLSGKVALITGAAQGIGAAIAEYFASEGAKVFLVDQSKKTLQTQLGKMDQAVAQGMTLDVAAAGASDKALKACLKVFGQCDILVNNAGITHAAEFLDLKLEDFDRVLGVNLRSYLSFGQALAKHWVKQKRPGVVVNMSSVNAILAIPNQVPYVVSKGAVNQLTKVMAMSLAEHHIRVNAIGPGTIATELAVKAVMNSESARTKVMSRTPLRRLGEPIEVAKVALFLACDDSSYMTGQIIYPDGGRLALNYTVATE